MPGYKKHLLGGTISFSLTLGAVLTWNPLLLNNFTTSYFSLLPIIINNVLQVLNRLIPQLVIKQVSPMNKPVMVMIEWFVCSLCGSLFPDVDIKSKGQQLFYRLVAIALVCCIVMNYQQLSVYTVLLLILPLLVHHRGLFHRAWFVIIGCSILWWLGSLAYPTVQHALLYDLLFFCTGALSHLWLDMGLQRMFRIRW